ncbi:Uncharacterised protein [Vibrio cholerae]|nr:Uncharacterised protein [Vibrio cholerae]
MTKACSNKVPASTTKYSAKFKIAPSPSPVKSLAIKKNTP